jgi:hypothetical protein
VVVKDEKYSRENVQLLDKPKKRKVASKSARELNRFLEQDKQLIVNARKEGYMAFYLVTAKPIRSKMNNLRKWLDSGEIRSMKPFGQALHTGLDHARWQSEDVAIWEEEDYCVPPLAQERAAVLDEYFTDLEVENVNKGEGWRQIDSMKKIWENHDQSIRFHRLCKN